MQLYVDQAGLQRLTHGKVSIDADTGEPVHEVIWDTDTDGGQIDPAKVGGYSRDKETLSFSQGDFDAHQTLKATLTATAAAQAATLAKQAAIALISSSTGQPVTELQKAFAKATAFFLEVEEEVFVAKVLEFLQPGDAQLNSSAQAKEA